MSSFWIVVLDRYVAAQLRTMVEQIPSVEQPQHKIVSSIGNMSHHGQAGRYEVVLHLSDGVGSQAYPVLTPVVATSVEERELFQTQRSCSQGFSRAGQSDLCGH